MLLGFVANALHTFINFTPSKRRCESFDGAQLISSGKFSKKNFPVACLIRELGRTLDVNT
jgi:hypothetical protein